MVDSTSIRILLTVLFSVVGLGTGFVGVHSAFNVTSLSEMLFALLCIGASANAVVAAILLNNESGVLGPTLGAATTGLLGSAYLIWVDVNSIVIQPAWMWPAGIVLAASGMAIVYILLLYKKTPVAVWKFLAALLLPLWGVIQFWYETQYQPSRMRPQASLSSSIEGLGLDAEGRAIAKSRLELDNAGGARVQIIGSLYRVLGVRQRPAVEPDLQGSTSAQLAHSFEWTNNGRRFVAGMVEEIDLLQADEVMPITAFLEGGEMWSTDFVTAVSPDAYDMIRLDGEIYVARSGGLKLGEAQECDESASAGGDIVGLPSPAQRGSGEEFVCMDQPVVPRNAVYSYLDDDPIIRRELIVSSAVRLGPYPQINVFFGRQDAAGTFVPDQTSFQEQYPAVVLRTRSEMAPAIEGP